MRGLCIFHSATGCPHLYSPRAAVPAAQLRPLCEFVSQSEVVVYGDLDILFGAQIPFGGLDGGMPQQKLNLFQIAPVLAAQFRASPAQVMGAEVLDPDLLR